MKRIILIGVVALMLGASMDAERNKIKHAKEIEIPLVIKPQLVIIPEDYSYKPTHEDVEYTYRSQDGKITFKYHWCLQSGLKELFTHPLFKKLDLRYLKDFRHIYHTDKINEGVPTSYIVFGQVYFEEKGSYIRVNTRVEHFTPQIIKAIVWHEFVHLLIGKGGHCYGPDCPILTMAGSNVKIEEMAYKFDDKAKTEMLQYIIRLQKNWI